MRGPAQHLADCFGRLAVFCLKTQLRLLDVEKARLQKRYEAHRQDPVDPDDETLIEFSPSRPRRRRHGRRFGSHVRRNRIA